MKFSSCPRLSTETTSKSSCTFECMIRKSATRRISSTSNCNSLSDLVILSLLFRNSLFLDAWPLVRELQHGRKKPSQIQHIAYFLPNCSLSYWPMSRKSLNGTLNSEYQRGHTDI